MALQRRHESAENRPRKVDDGAVGDDRLKTALVDRDPRCDISAVAKPREGDSLVHTGERPQPIECDPERLLVVRSFGGLRVSVHDAAVARVLEGKVVVAAADRSRTTAEEDLLARGIVAADLCRGRRQRYLWRG